MVAHCTVCQNSRCHVHQTFGVEARAPTRYRPPRAAAPVALKIFAPHRTVARDTVDRAGWATFGVVLPRSHTLSLAELQGRVARRIIFSPTSDLSYFTYCVCLSHHNLSPIPLAQQLSRGPSRKRPPLGHFADNAATCFAVLKLPPREPVGGFGDRSRDLFGDASRDDTLTRFARLGGTSRERVGVGCTDESSSLLRFSSASSSKFG